MWAIKNRYKIYIHMIYNVWILLVYSFSFYAFKTTTTGCKKWISINSSMYLLPEIVYS
jgi:hypothetical protein